MTPIVLNIFDITSLWSVKDNTKSGTNPTLNISNIITTKELKK